MGRGIVSDALDRAQKERDLVLREQAGARDEAKYQADLAKRNEIEALKAGLRNPNADNYALKGTGSGAGINMPAQPTDTPQGDAEVTPTNYGLGSPAGGLGLRAPRSARAAPGVDATETPTPAATGLRGGSQIPAVGATFKPGKSLADEQDVVAQIALANNDIAGFNNARNNRRTFQLDDINAEVAKLTPEELLQESSKLNLPGTSIPMLSLGATKGGYKFLSTDPVTGAAGKEFKLSDSQVRQMLVASRMAERGFGTEAMAALAGVDKDVADHISKWNQALQSVATSNNDALGKQDTVRLKERELDQTAEYQRGVLQNQRAAAARESRNPLLEKVNALEKLGVKLTPAEIKKLAGAGAAAFDPADYASTVSRFVSSGMELKDARYAADELFGVPSAPVNDSSLVSQNESRDPKTRAPVERPSATGLVRQLSDAYNGESPAWFDLRGQAARAAYGVATRKPEQTK